MLASIGGGRALERCGFGAVLSFVLCNTATAGLGGHQDALVIDGPNTVSVSSTTQLPGASLHTQRLADGVTLRQYVNPAGQVFAVGWEGPVLPDFHRLLGEHFQRYSDALRQQSRHVHIQSSDLVLEAGGMMRAFSGYAYLPSQLPPTLSGADIR
jgi:hypothetical protein